MARPGGHVLHNIIYREHAKDIFLPETTRHRALVCRITYSVKFVLMMSLGPKMAPPRGYVLHTYIGKM